MYGHFGEIVQGPCRGYTNDMLVVSMPCRKLYVQAVYTPHMHPFTTNAGEKVHRLAQIQGITQGHIQITTTTPSGFGYGRSTMDVLASVRALNIYANNTMISAHEASLVLKAEGASDPLMYPLKRLPVFAPRTGKHYGYIGAMPACTLIGGHVPDLQVNTLAYTDNDWPDVGDLYARLLGASPEPDLVTVADVATCSAQRGQAVVYNPCLDDMIRYVRPLGALGVVRAHTGSAIGWIFPPAAVLSSRQTAIAVQILQTVGVEPFVFLP